MKSWPWSVIWSAFAALVAFLLMVGRSEWRVGAMEEHVRENRTAIQQLDNIREEQGNAILQIQNDVGAIKEDLSDLKTALTAEQQARELSRQKDQEFRESVRTSQLETSYLIKELLKKVATTP